MNLRRLILASLLFLSAPLTLYAQSQGTKVSQLPSANTPLTGAELIVADQGTCITCTVTLTPAQIAAYIEGLPNAISLSTGVRGNLPVTNLNGGINASGTTFWSGDNTWKVVPGGSLSSVALTAPSLFSITGSPLTGSGGTLALAFAPGQTANQVLATPNGTTGAAGLRALVGLDIPAINLAASGNGGVTGNLPVGNLNGGTNASATTVWCGTGTWCTPPSSATSANPTALVGPTAIPGSASTLMRSDAAPALNTAAAYTWTGNNIFSGPGGPQPALTVISPASGQAFAVNNNANSGQYFIVNSTGATSIQNVTAGTALTVNGSAGTDAILANASADLTGITIGGAQNNVSLNLNNTKSGATPAWRISSSATGSGFGAGNLVFGNGSTANEIISPAGNVTFTNQVAINAGGLIAIGAGGSDTNAISAAATVGTAPATVDIGEIVSISNRSTAGGDQRLLSFGQVGANAFIRPVVQGSPGSAPGLSIVTPSGGTTFGPAGNVTIAAPSSGNALTVNGNVTLPSANATLSMASATTAATINVGNGLIQGDGTNMFVRPQNAGSSLALGAGGTNWITLNSTGTLFTSGINATSGVFSGGVNASQFSATSAAATQVNAFGFQQGSQPGWLVYQPASSNDFRIFENGADRLTITSAGAVTIPGSLSVAGSPVVTNSGTWGINITGNAATATTAATANTASTITGTYAGPLTSAQVTGGLGFTPVQQGGGSGQLANKVFIGWNGSGGLQAQVDSTNFGTTWPISVSGNAATASAIPYTNVTGKPAFAPSATIDTTNASNITSGVLAPAAISGAYAGITGLGTLTSGSIPTSLLTGLGSFAPTLTGAGASGTWGINISGSSASASAATTATNQAGGSVSATTGNFSGLVSATGTIQASGNESSAIATATGGLGALWVYNSSPTTGPGGAFMTFHRQGSYAAYFGLDTDNVLKFGGWSAGANAYPIAMGNGGTYAMSITGNAATATTAATATNLSGGTVNATSGGFTSLGVTVGAASQVNALTLTQAGQQPWLIYQPASSSDFRIWAGTDRLTINSAGAVNIPGSLTVGGVAVTGGGGGGSTETTATLTITQGCTTTPSATIHVSQIGQVVTLTIPYISCAVSGSPPVITARVGAPIPATPHVIPYYFQNGNGTGIGYLEILNGGGVTELLFGSTTAVLSGTFGTTLNSQATSSVATYTLY